MIWMALRFVIALCGQLLALWQASLRRSLELATALAAVKTSLAQQTAKPTLVWCSAVHTGSPK